MHGILTHVFATQADILTSMQSTPAYANASPRIERSPTIYKKSAASVQHLAPFIFGAGSLDQWAITHSFEDGCF